MKVIVIFFSNETINKTNLIRIEKYSSKWIDPDNKYFKNNMKKARDKLRQLKFKQKFNELINE